MSVMRQTTAERGSAAEQGELWGARPRWWAESERQQRPIYDEVFRRTRIEAGARVLDVGCGSGAFLRAAADRGARVTGIDASEALIEIARARVPEADLRVGDMQFLPYEDDVFDLVTGLTSFFFAADMTAALREAGRVASPGAPVVIVVWGNPERCELTPTMRALGALLAPRPQGPALSRPGVLEAIAAEAGLVPGETGEVRFTFEFDDDDAALRTIMSAANAVRAARAVGEQAVRAAALESLAPYRRADGSYSLTNEWHLLVASAA